MEGVIDKPEGIANPGLDCYWITLVQCLRNFQGIPLDWLNSNRNSQTQEDAHETLLQLLDQQGFPEDKFKIEMTKLHTCESCGFKKEKNEVNTVWSAPVSEEKLTHNLAKSISPYYVEGVLCDGCKERSKYRISTKKIKQPDIFVVHLQRFEYTSHGTRKLTNHVEYPEQINVAGVKYELKSIACHIGNAYNGHYFAVVKQGDKWYLCNDEQVEEIEEIKPTPYAYLLFYRRI